MKLALAALALVSSVSFAGPSVTRVIQNYPNQVITETYPVYAWGVKLPDQCTSTYNWATFQTSIFVKDGAATSDRWACEKAWFAAIPKKAEPK
jgi:hypothetical protein